MSTQCIEKNHFIDMDSIRLIHSERKGKPSRTIRNQKILETYSYD